MAWVLIIYKDTLLGWKLKGKFVQNIDI